MSVVVVFALNTVFNFAISLLVATFLGPAEYGRFALATAVAVFLNTALFDWLRLSATRFYSERVRAEDPSVRATLDAIFGGVTLALALAAATLILSGLDLPVTGSLLALAVAASVASAVFDYHTALIRARFLDAAYRRVVLAKHATALICTAGGAWLFQSAQTALAGICLSAVFAVASARRDLVDPGASPRGASADHARAFLRYAFPIVLSSIIYQTIPLMNRASVASEFGFAETGQFALAFDIAIRLVAAIGSSLDVLLFQLAVRAEEAGGAERAMERASKNMGLVFALMLPTCLGCWLALPSFEAVFAPAAYRGLFAQYVTLFLPGIFAYAMLQFAIAPVFQITKSTTPLVIAALAAAIANMFLLGAMGTAQDASGHAATQAAAFSVGFVTLAAFAALRTGARPRWRDIGLTCLACAAMTAALLPLRAMQPGFATLLLQVGLGAGLCVGLYLVFDVGEARRLLAARAKLALARRKA